MGHLGFEPRTDRLRADYSTIELVTQEISLIKLSRFGGAFPNHESNILCPETPWGI